MTDRFDELRQQHPDLGFALYAMTPGGAVTLEVFTPDGQVYAFQGMTAHSVIDGAFPELAEPEPFPLPEPTPAPAGDIFE